MRRIHGKRLSKNSTIPKFNTKHFLKVKEEKEKVKDARVVCQSTIGDMMSPTEQHTFLATS